MALSTRWKEAPGDWWLMVQAKYSCNMEKLLVFNEQKTYISTGYGYSRILKKKHYITEG